MSARTKARRAGFNYAAQWETSKDEEMILPSGKVVVLRPPDLARMVKAGKIPNHMIGSIERFIIGGVPTLLKEFPGIEADEKNPGAALIKRAELADYMEVMCVCSIVEPKFVFDGETGGIPISMMSGDDRFAIWDWGVGLTATMARFRELRERAVESVESLSGGEAVRDEAESDAGVEQSA